MNQKGYSLPEALLTVAVLFIIFGTLIPVVYHMTEQLAYKKYQMHAAEAMVQAILLTNSTGELEGQFTKEQVEYNWIKSHQQVCINYQFGKKLESYCLS